MADLHQVPEDYEGPVIPLAGATFRVAERVGGLALMRFAKVAQGGTQTSDLAGLAAMYDLLQAVIDPEDWPAFEAHADQTRVSDDELFDAVMTGLEAATDRPTSPPSDSSDGRSTTRASSPDDSFWQVIGDLEQRGRPDLAVFVDQAAGSSITG